jgi:hypothetical protein
MKNINGSYMLSQFILKNMADFGSLNHNNKINLLINKKHDNAYYILNIYIYIDSSYLK